MFLHDAVLESLTCGDTQISAGNLRTAMKRLGKMESQTQTSGYDHEFKVQPRVIKYKSHQKHILLMNVIAKFRVLK